jgi:hypothetical protein
VAHVATAAETCVARLDMFRTCQLDLAAFRKDFEDLEDKFATEAAGNKDDNHPKKGFLSPAVDDLLHHYSVGTTAKATVEQGLEARSRRLEQDVQRVSTSLETSLRAYLDTLPRGTEKLVSTAADVENDLAAFEGSIGDMRAATEGVDLTVVEGEIEARNRFLAKWQEFR